MVKEKEQNMLYRTQLESNEFSFGLMLRWLQLELNENTFWLIFFLT